MVILHSKMLVYQRVNHPKCSVRTSGQHLIKKVRLVRCLNLNFYCYRHFWLVNPLNHHLWWLDPYLLLLKSPFSNWWLTYPPEKYELVRLDHHPNYWAICKIPWFQTTNQFLLVFLHYQKKTPKPFPLQRGVAFPHGCWRYQGCLERGRNCNHLVKMIPIWGFP